MSKNFANETFRSAEPSWANACVGENGSPDIVDYAAGFANAAQVLLEQVIHHRGLKHPTDTFVYPICFNMRHAIELYIKAAIESLRPLVHHGYRLPNIDTQTSHDIGMLWRYLKEHSVALDWRYKNVIELLDTAISDFAEVDSTGQVFRYPFGRENQKHLTELAIINLLVLWSKFRALVADLKTLNYHGEFLGDEYRHQTYTAHLSRFDLACIGYQLPPRAEWGSNTFEAAKVVLRGHFNLSSNEFSRALKLIEGNIELAAIIDAPCEFKYLTPVQLNLFFDSWCKIVGIDDVKRRYAQSPEGRAALVDAEVSSASSWSIEEMTADATLRTEIWPTLRDNISPEAFGEIRALHYFSRSSLRYSEDFERERQIAVRDALAARDAGEARLRQTAFYLMSKPAALEHVLNSLLFFGHVDVVDELLKRSKLTAIAGLLLEPSLRRFRRRRREVSEAINSELRYPKHERYAVTQLEQQ
ncbi:MULTISPECIES: hypothetical protein [Burkholderia]|uniref:Uncharacterized protein n=1 Tax=Burkholderia pyrrocinia TaxID=60550 RepID=A0A318JBQ6_BURPY|nr:MULTISPECIES: hypothetical protein [Burkholderia]PXX41248.1 hypothetical protein NA66_1001858 [Burkholderia pyrrocinia]SFW82318.1 hypothetical protein SAMN03159384_05562 [Burkholderia sp. NFACC33-1]SFY44038.1 hypothetical protein SAMN03159408_05718 [Burkholderia sp. NFPP32]